MEEAPERFHRGSATDGLPGLKPHARLRQGRAAMGFFDFLEAICEEKHSLLCVGLDPYIPPDTKDPRGAILDANTSLIRATAEYAAAFKPNLAFYEAWGSLGLAALEETLSLIPSGIPIILDAKRCDIGNTAEAYARGLFGHLGADAVTLSPYMGKDAASPFLAYPDKGIFMLARTSNPSARFIQDRAFEGSADPLYVDIARECLGWGPAVGLVVAGNDYEALRRVRKLAPEAWFLAPGVGAQGGDAGKAVTAGMRPDGMGMLVVVVRAISQAQDPGAAAASYRDLIQAAIPKR
jgi:uridine monophosphate synthetase